MAAQSDLEFAVRLLFLSIGDARRARVICSSYMRWKDRSGLAWDLCRAANVVNQGYNAGYADEQQTWNRYFAIAELMQKSFSSWQEMSDNFLDGREIWAGERSSQFEACSQLLLNPKDPNSPWNQNPWNTPLSGTPSSDPTSGQ